MKAFTKRELIQARAHAATGGQALYVPDDTIVGVEAQRVAYLLDQDYNRLLATAHRLGAFTAAPFYPGTPRQCVELRGRPLREAVDAIAREHDAGRRHAAREERLRASVLAGFNDLEDWLRKI